MHQKQHLSRPLTLTLTLTQVEHDGSQLTGKLCLVDLAGSELGSELGLYLVDFAGSEYEGSIGGLPHGAVSHEMVYQAQHVPSQVPSYPHASAVV